jgi:hypothetical protein
MGWRADAARDRDEREEWRRYIASLPRWERLFLRARGLLILAVIAFIIVGPFVIGTLRGH